jgi:hypothetical protein
MIILNKYKAIICIKMTKLKVPQNTNYLSLLDILKTKFGLQKK